LIYEIRHLTTFQYTRPIRETVMELRMKPCSDRTQRCLDFTLDLEPEARVLHYPDFMGNAVHHFDVPGSHETLRIEAVSLVERLPPAPLPETLHRDAWEETDRQARNFQNWDWIQPSHFARQTSSLRAFAEELRITRRDDPLTALKDLNHRLHQALAYEPRSTRVDSPIDECLARRRGVCQDFAHVFIALARRLGIPCRYVSGHLFHRPGNGEPASPDASHAWAEALLPLIGWVGFDVVNEELAGERHIRVAVGRDYQDVPPTRGVFKGQADSRLSVQVDVRAARPEL
jgi:transglutaminase-like putative cysteine protease